MNEKWSDKLKEATKAASDRDDVHVVLELNKPAPPSPSVSRSDRLKVVQDSFSKQAKPIKEKIETLGGKITGEAWINSTIAAKVSPQALEELEQEDCVKHLDVPNELKRES